MNSRSEKYRKIDRKFLWHPYSNHSAISGDDFPVIVRGKGPYLFDCEGKRYFDAISSWWCCNLGHNHPRLVEAIRAQAGKLQHSILGNMSHPPAIELAEKIGNLFKAKRRVFFSSDGASAVEAAIKIAVQYWHHIGQPKRCRLVSFENAYHGDTLGAVSAGYLPHFHKPFQSLLFPVLRAAAPFCVKCSLGRSPDTCQCECFKSMQTVIEKHHHNIAAVIIEPLCQCAAGMRIYEGKYLKKLAQLCRKHKILLIADEIAVGFGRTGTMFAFEQAGIDPDIVCLGKSLAGGYLPISATVVKENIYSSFSDLPKAAGPPSKTSGRLTADNASNFSVNLSHVATERSKDNTFYHGHTFAGNPIAAAAAIETLKIFKEERILDQTRRKSKIMANLISRLCSNEGVRNARCLGMIAAFDMNNAAKAPLIKKAMLKAGVLIRPLGNTIYLMPPLISPDGLLADTISLLAETLKDAK